MNNIAFKRAKTSPNTKDSLHPEFIVEHADTSLFPDGFHKPEDGYEILSKDMFDVEFAKNDELHEEFLAKKKQEHADRLAAGASVINQEAAQERKDKREYEEFLKWKKMKGKG
jgi:hypothetical protein